jgi:acetyl esterase/lipase
MEETVQHLFDIDPVAIAMQMRDATGQIYTCYWNVSRDDRACMIGGMQDDDMLDFIAANKDTILEILNGEEDDEDGIQDADTEADSEG